MTTQIASTEKRIRLVIEGELCHVGLVGMALRSICQLTSLPLDEVDKVELAIVEAVNNVIEHAYAGRSDAPPVEILVGFGADHLAVEIRDIGRPMAPGVLEQTEFSVLDIQPGIPETLPDGGIGIFLLKVTMDSIYYERVDGVNILRLIKYFAPPPKAS